MAGRGTRRGHVVEWKVYEFIMKREYIDIEMGKRQEEVEERERKR